MKDPIVKRAHVLEMRERRKQETIRKHEAAAWERHLARIRWRELYHEGRALYMSVEEARAFADRELNTAAIRV